VHGAGEDRDQYLFSSPAELGLFGGKVLALRGLNQVEVVEVESLLAKLCAARVGAPTES